jgi:homoserine dehydrogenase
LVAVSARSPKPDLPLDGVRWDDDPLALARAADIDCVVELMGGAEGPALALAEATLAAGKPLVTANKALLAAHGLALARAAEAKGVALRYEAAVAGGIPVIKALLESLAGNRIDTVAGILNGTCNYILTRMAAEGLSFEAVLADAQKLGYAEADPATDVDGWDSAHKLALLAALAFGAPPDLASLSVQGIRSITPLDHRFAAELGYRIKLLGVATRSDDGVEARVAPALLPVGSPLAGVDGVINAVSVKGAPVGTVTFVGPGAGGDPTASAVLGDVVDVARGAVGLPFGRAADALRPWPLLPVARRRGAWYVRLCVSDQPGVVAGIAGILRDEAISIESLLQFGRSRTDSVPVILITHDVAEDALFRAVDAIAGLPFVWDKPFCLRLQPS